MYRSGHYLLWRGRVQKAIARSTTTGGLIVIVIVIIIIMGKFIVGDIRKLIIIIILSITIRELVRIEQIMALTGL